MPYLPIGRKKELDVQTVGQVEAKCGGDLNYIFSRVINTYIEKQGECYKVYNDIVGAIENCKLELYRRKTAPYEDQAIKRNGDL